MKKTLPLAAHLKEQLQNRSLSTLATVMKSQTQVTKNGCYLIGSSDDRGVMRNGGRKGARFAPQAIMRAFSIMQKNQSPELGQIYSSARELTSDFEADQLRWSQEWAQYFTQASTASTIHLGGGHDHIFPLLMGLDQSLKQSGDSKALVVVNFDAHLDTRTDLYAHSGTPFRQAAKELSRPLHLIQWGIHASANSLSTCEALNSPHRTTLVSYEEVQKISNPAEHLLNLVGSDHLVLSLDADAIDGAIMRAVSAVNARGLKSDHIFECIESLARKAKAFGIYEYNPIFDDLSNYGARLLAKLCLSFFEARSRV